MYVQSYLGSDDIRCLLGSEVEGGLGGGLASKRLLDTMCTTPCWVLVIFNICR